MAVTAYVYNLYKQKLLSGTDLVDFDADTLKVALCTSSYTPNLDTHDFYNDITATEVANGSGYTTGGMTLTTKTVSLDTTSDFAYFSADPLTWTTASFTTRYAVLYKSTGNSATSPLIGYIDFGADQVNSGGDFTINWANAAAGGILKIA